jgi:hypothetical protein
MKNILTIIAMFFLMLSSRPAGGMTGTVADLPSDLREALLHDAVCAQAGDAGASSESGPASLLASQVNAQEIRGAKAGTVVGVIATLSSGCHCHGPNCGTYVYLKSDSGYKLAFAGEFASLHPSRVYKSGYPSLSAKAQISETEAESTVYDWNGKSYVPNLCATITQSRGRKVPAIVHHPCPKAP